MNALEVPVLNQKEESSESEEEEENLQSKVLCASITCTGEATWWPSHVVLILACLTALEQSLLTQGTIWQLIYKFLN